MATQRKRTDRDPFPHSPRNIRLDAGLSVHQVAELMSLPASAVRRFETGRSNPTAKTIAGFYAACGRGDLAARLMFFLDDAKQDRVAEIEEAWQTAYGPGTDHDPYPGAAAPAA